MAPKRWMYKVIPQGDDSNQSSYHDDSISTLSEKPQPRLTESSTCRSRLSITHMLSLCLNILLISSILFVVFLRQTPDNGHDSENLEVFGHIPNEDIVFQQDPDHEKGLNASVKWHGLHESFDGFVKIQHPQKYGLTGGYPFPATNPDGEIYCISAFHQLHCLADIRKELETPSEYPRDILMEAHLSHCLSYLRQAIMCSADLTLEKTTWDMAGVQQFGATGWGNVHTCRNWDAIMAFTKEHRQSIQGFNQVKAESQ